MKNTLILLLLAFTSFAFADFLDAGEAYENENYDQALSEYQALAKLGHHEAQHNLAVMHFLGQGTEKNPVQAFAWAGLAKASKDTKLQALQDTIKGNLSAEQLTEARQQAQTLQNQYGAEAIKKLWAPPESKTGQQFSNKNNLTFNSSDYTVTAVERKAPYYPRSALRKGIQGWVKASFEIHPDGSLRRPMIIDSFPEGVFDEPTLKAFHGFRFDVQFKPGIEPYPVSGIQTMQFQIGRDAKKYQDLYQERINELHELADNGHPDAHFYLAMAYDENSLFTLASGQATDQLLINTHLFKAAQSGQVDAQYHLGNNLFSGKDNYQDKDKGIRWLILAAEQNHAQAARRLSLIFKANPKMNHTEHPAHYWMAQAAEAGDLDAQLNYAEWLSENSDNTEEIKYALTLLDNYADDRPETILWYQTAARLQHKSNNPKKAQKYQKKADKLAKKLGWEI